MKEFIKKAGLTFWLSAAACLLALIGAIIFIATNATAGYAVLNGGLGIAMAIIGAVLIAGGAYLTMKFGAQHYITAAVKLVALVLLCVALGVLINDRAGLVADLFTWDSHNALGWSVFSTSVVAMVFILLSVVTLIVCAFFGDKKQAAE